MIEGFRGRGVGSPAAQGRPRRGRTAQRRPAGLQVPRRSPGASLTCTGSFSWPPEPERPQREPPNPRPAEPPPPACAMLEVRSASAPPPPEPRSRLRGSRPRGWSLVASRWGMFARGTLGGTGWGCEAAGLRGRSKRVFSRALWRPGSPKMFCFILLGGKIIFSQVGKHFRTH